LNTGTNIWHLWVNIIQEYSRKRLTNATDRLPALSGLARDFKKAGLGTYCAGLWSKNLAYWLLWTTAADLVEPVDDRRKSSAAPTWSWASVSHGVDILDQWGQHGTTESGIRVHGQVDRVFCKAAGLDPTGTTSEGILVVTAPI
jgi:hypothetical protein